MINVRMMNGNANVCEVATAIKEGISLTLSSCQIHHCQGWLPASLSSPPCPTTNTGAAQELRSGDGEERRRRWTPDAIKVRQSGCGFMFCFRLFCFFFVLFCFWFLFFLLCEWDTNPLSVLFIRSRTSQEEENYFDKTVDWKEMKSVWNVALNQDLY